MTCILDLISYPALSSRNLFQSPTSSSSGPPRMCMHPPRFTPGPITSPSPDARMARSYRIPLVIALKFVMFSSVAAPALFEQPSCRFLPCSFTHAVIWSILFWESVFFPLLLSCISPFARWAGCLPFFFYSSLAILQMEGSLLELVFPRSVSSGGPSKGRFPLSTECPRDQ